MDAQQELFSEMLAGLREKFGNVYDSKLPPAGTPYPFVYLAGTSQSGGTKYKDAAAGTVTQTVNVWHDKPDRRGDVSAMLYDIRRTAEEISATENYTWFPENYTQDIMEDTTTGTPLVHGILNFDYTYYRRNK